MVKIKWQHKINGSAGEISLLESEVQDWKSKHIIKEEGHYPEYLEGAPYVDRISPDGSTERLYFRLAEYSIDFLETIEETLLEIRARKLSSLSAISLERNQELRKSKEYRSDNAFWGMYDSEPQTIEKYRQAFLARSSALKSEYKRCEALVNSLITEEAINAVQFNVE